MKTQNTLNLLSKKNYLGRVITTVQRDYKGVAIETAEIVKKADTAIGAQSGEPKKTYTHIELVLLTSFILRTAIGSIIFSQGRGNQI